MSFCGVGEERRRRFASVPHEALAYSNGRGYYWLRPSRSSFSESFQQPYSRMLALPLRTHRFTSVICQVTSSKRGVRIWTQVCSAPKAMPLTLSLLSAWFLRADFISEVTLSLRPWFLSRKGRHNSGVVAVVVNGWHFLGTLAPVIKKSHSGPVGCSVDSPVNESFCPKTRPCVIMSVQLQLKNK